MPFKQTQFIKIFLLFFLAYLCMQIEISSKLLHEGWQGIKIIFLSQHINILVSVAIALLYLPLASIKFGRQIFLGFTIIYFTYLIVDRHFYKLMFDHIKLGYLEGDANANLMKDSVLAQINGTSVFYIAIAILFVLWMHNILFTKQPKIKFQNKKMLWLFAIGVIVYLPFSLHKIKQNNHYQLSIHPLMTTFGSLLFPTHYDLKPMIEITDDELYSLKFGTDSLNHKYDSLFKSYTSKLNTAQPNVIFLILESVGSKNLFSKTALVDLDSATTPNLYNLKKSMWAFPNIYSHTPATTRTQFTISTGGYDMTYGSSTELLKYTFNGPTIFSSFKDNGYQTALFSAQYLLDALQVYDKLPIDHKAVPDLMSESERSSRQLNSWGVQENTTIRDMAKWLEKYDKSRPFFMQMNTSCTHHPYSQPKDFKPLQSDPSDEQKYQASLKYTDKIIGDLIELLHQKKLDSNTIIAICGDHGEAFGTAHKTNFLHKNYIYEENIKSFLIWIDPTRIKDFQRIEHKSNIGAVGATLVGHLSKNNLMPAKSLFQENNKQQLVYFFKGSSPEQWGLIDGKWKFIAPFASNEKAELYDLEKDPSEQNNLASQYLKRHATYSELCKNWYVQQHRKLAPKLIGYNFMHIDKNEVTIEGPKQINIGIITRQETFSKKNTIHPNEDFVAFSRGIPFKQNTIMQYEWISPKGKKLVQYFEHDSKWSYTWLGCKIKRPLDEGKWELVISAKNNSNKNLKTSFIVSNETKLIQRFQPPWLLEAIFTKVNNNVESPATTFTNGDKIRLKMKSTVQTYDKNIVFRWLAPSGQIENNVGVYYQKFPYKKGWNHAWIDAPLPKNCEKGRWSVGIFDSDAKKSIATLWFDLI